jgi:hypothetical protein
MSVGRGHWKINSLLLDELHIVERFCQQWSFGSDNDNSSAALVGYLHKSTYSSPPFKRKEKRWSHIPDARNLSLSTYLRALGKPH